MKTRSCSIALVVLALAVAAAPVAAQCDDTPGDKNGILNAWKSIYPASQSDDNVEAGTGSGCQLCHRDASGGNPWNAYGWRLRQFIDTGSSDEEAILLAAGFDSDGDPGEATNQTEIDADTQPGWTTGPANTHYFKNGSTDTGQLPPSGILGSLDPVGAGIWADLGNGLAGTHGIPGLAGSGTLLGGDPISIDLTDALENTTAYLVVGLTRIDAPFKGGVLVPDLDIAGFPLALPTGPLGEVPLNATWPPGVPGAFTTYYQYWILDPAGPVGFSASNAISGSTP